ncbi:19476_t:CDS:2 [Racocetra fulgida]|uniref:19476_t:CDS:1 n=1 Tax=Racocetra fulgida TaxID=60492 RepID=A0A9N9A3Z9_9GLOM|nr:19476_t:CDS:2 [Racocetra fulgida]
MTKDEIYESFYDELKAVPNDPESPEAYNKARELLNAKEGQETDVTSPASSKKKSAVEDTG